MRFTIDRYSVVERPFRSRHVITVTFYSDPLVLYSRNSDENTNVIRDQNDWKKRLESLRRAAGEQRQLSSNVVNLFISKRADNLIK